MTQVTFARIEQSHSRTLDQRHLQLQQLQHKNHASIPIQIQIQIQMQSKLSYSTDQLIDASKKHVQFLRDLHKHGTTTAFIQRHSLVRYTDLWLPLVATHQQYSDRDDDDKTPQIIALVPPPDVAWLWHCHRLAPSHYETYVKKTFGGKLLEATPPFCFQDTFDEHDHTQRAWKKNYPDEPFLHEPIKEGEGPSSLQEIVVPDQYYVGKHDLIASVKSQAAFLWQVSGPRFADDAFLQEGVRRYNLFLQITDCTLPLVPTYQIDLMWHTHMLLSTDKYNQDCIRIRGHVFHHDDSLNDRTPGSNLDQAYRATMELYQCKYKELYQVEGGMYRGEPPASYWSRCWVPTSNASKGAAMGALASSGMLGATSSGKHIQKASFIKMSRPREPQIEGYVFGNGTQGMGHYSLDERSWYTLDAYNILLLRLNKRIQVRKAQMDNIVCTSFGCCGDTMNAVAQDKYDAIAKEVDDMIKMKENIEFALQHNCTTPPEASLKRAQDTAILDSNTTGACWYLNYSLAAGCGGGFGDAGEGGWGEGGWGGGGCGGGGCGGG